MIVFFFFFFLNKCFKYCFKTLVIKRRFLKILIKSSLLVGCQKMNFKLIVKCYTYICEICGINLLKYMYISI